ncbi:MAG TPA: alpha/beta hydrolase [Kofleriaceae bacterium]|nr:alpha/beta hydrolase [Kofleriaceae bacterium]
MQWSLEHGMMVRRTGDGPRVVWIHGLGEQSASFDATVARLPGYQHVLVDLPGYGRSPWPEQPPSLVDTVARLISWIGEDAPVLAGHSLGGVFAQLVAEHIPVAGVIDIDGNLTRGDCTFSAQASAYRADAFSAHGFDELRDDVYKRGIADPALRGYYAAMRAASPAVFHRHATELVELSSTETLVARLAALRVPVLYIAGVPGGICERSQQLLTAHRVRWVDISESGHWPFIDQPDAFVDATRELLMHTARR